MIGLLGGIITTCGGLPQIIKITQTKSADDLSWGMLILWLTGLSMTLGYGLYTNQVPVYVPTMLSIIMIVLKWWHGRQAYSPLINM